MSFRYLFFITVTLGKFSTSVTLDLIRSPGGIKNPYQTWMPDQVRHDKVKRQGRNTRKICCFTSFWMTTKTSKTDYVWFLSYPPFPFFAAKSSLFATWNKPAAEYSGSRILQRRDLRK